MSTVSYDSRAVLIDGRRTLLLSGSIHYPRSTPAMWPGLMQVSRESGLNTIETYVFWNLHERRRGVLDFSDRLDLPRFCRLVQAAGLRMILRIGPYICAETNYGGFPAWLRDVPGMRMRTWNQPFMDEMERWMRALCEVLRPMFAPAGGPIILAQIENEYANVARQYGEDGRRYLAWCADLAKSLNLGIPWVMCSGAAPGVLETINGGWPHAGIDAHAREHPDQPALCTELWPGWYETWGYPSPVRSPESLAGAVARFVAAGATGVNYYMWHAGTNFGREAMYLQTTHYGFSTLDEFGRPTTVTRHMARLHHLLSEHADALLESARPSPVPLGEKQAAWIYGQGDRRLALLSNDDEKAAAQVTFEGAAYDLAPQSTQILGGGRVLMDTARVEPASVVRRTVRPIERAISKFVRWQEPAPSEWPQEFGPPIVANKPVEQLSLTHDETDYCWYSTSVVAGKSDPAESVLVLEGAADVIHVFVDGRLAATTPTPLKEDRGPVDGAGFRQEFRLKLAPGRHKLSLLACALGLIKGDWMLGGANMAEERKGLWGPVRWNDKIVKGPWRMRPGLVGERVGLPGDGGALARWRPVTGQGRQRPLGWYRATFARPAGDGPVVLDLRGMTKGLAWVNGRCVGRYWLLPSTGGREPWLTGWTSFKGDPQPTQWLYHVPREWLSESNTLVLFDELGGDPTHVALCRA
jgi:hypothetical protein